MIDYCIAFFRRKKQETLYRIYVTDALMAIASNTAKMFGGKEMQMRYEDMINNKPHDEEQDKKDAAQVVDNIKEKLKKLAGG